MIFFELLFFHRAQKSKNLSNICWHDNKITGIEKYKTKKFNLLPPNDVNDEYLMLMVESLEKGLLS
jgi:hypothetical protein